MEGSGAELHPGRQPMVLQVDRLHLGVGHHLCVPPPAGLRAAPVHLRVGAAVQLHAHADLRPVGAAAFAATCVGVRGIPVFVVPKKASFQKFFVGMLVQGARKERRWS